MRSTFRSCHKTDTHMIRDISESVSYVQLAYVYSIYKVTTCVLRNRLHWPEQPQRAGHTLPLIPFGSTDFSLRQLTSAIDSQTHAWKNGCEESEKKAGVLRDIDTQNRLISCDSLNLRTRRSFKKKGSLKKIIFTFFFFFSLRTNLFIYSTDLLVLLI